MQIGMLWLDDSPKSDLSAKVRAAADYYRRKYGQEPNLCYAHPSMVPEDGIRVDDVEVRPLSDVLPHHLWLGVGEAVVRPQAAAAPAVLTPPHRRR